MKSEVLPGKGEDGKSYVVIKTTPLILGTGLEGIPSYRLETGERLIPSGKPTCFKLAASGVLITVPHGD